MNNETPAAEDLDLDLDLLATDTIIDDTPASRPQDANANANPKLSPLREQTRKKLEFVDNLMRNLDMLIYAELCILYYME